MLSIWPCAPCLQLLSTGSACLLAYAKECKYACPIKVVLLAAAGKIEGDVRINGHPKEQASFARVSGYVEQFDTHTAAATVKEALLFSGTLRNGKEVDISTTQDFVQQVWPPFRSPLFCATRLCVYWHPPVHVAYASMYFSLQACKPPMSGTVTF